MASASLSPLEYERKRPPDSQRGLRGHRLDIRQAAYPVSAKQLLGLRIVAVACDPTLPSHRPSIGRVDRESVALAVGLVLQSFTHLLPDKSFWSPFSPAATPLRAGYLQKFTRRVSAISPQTPAAWPSRGTRALG